MVVNKSTHQGYKTELFMPIIKTTEGKYLAVLSDDSTDRDGERISASCIEKFGNDDDYLAALLNHDNDIMNLVAEWVNKRVVVIGENTAYVAEPKFYESNPKAKIIRGMLDEGAKPGISISAMVLDYDEVDGIRLYTDLELLEASFVGIPSNKHGRAMAIAKSFNKVKIRVEAQKMEKEFTQKDIDSAIEKKVEEITSDFSKKLEDKDSEITKMKEELQTSSEKISEIEKSATEAAKTAEKNKTDLEKNLEDVKKEALEKQNFANQGGDQNPPEDIEKEFASGKIPIMHMNK